MLNKTSKGFRAFFLLQFTRELIRLSNGAEFVILKESEKIKSQKKEIKEIVHEKLKETSGIKQKTPSLTGNDLLPRPPIKIVPLPPRQLIPQAQAPMNLQTLRAPERLPPRLQYIQPIPTERQIDLGNLNALIQDPMVQSIECDGPDQKILIRTAANQAKSTEVVLSAEDISQIINSFSQESKIPVNEGVFRVVVGKLTLSAIISEVIGSKFIIKKLMAPRMMMGLPPRGPPGRMFR